MGAYDKFDEKHIRFEEITKRKVGKEFVIVFCGIFSSGKSSLLNCLLDYPDFKLPMGINPVTKLVTRIKYGTKLRFYFVGRNKNVEISKERFNDMVTGKKTANDINEIIIEIPSLLLKSGIVFLDTPGFQDEMGGRLEQISRDAVMESDLAVFCANALQLGTMFEKEFIDELQNGIGNFFMIVNRMDCLNSGEERKTVQERGMKLMENRGGKRISNFIGRNVFFTVAAGEYTNLGSFDSYIAQLFKNDKLMSDIKNSTFVRKKAFLLKALETEVENDIDELQELYNPILNQHNEIISEKRQEIALKNSELTTLRDKRANTCSIMINECFEQVFRYLRALENDNKNYTFVKDAACELKAKTSCLAKELEKAMQDLGGFTVSASFSKIIDEAAIPEPSPHFVKRGWLDAFLSGSKYDVYYSGYAEAAVNYLKQKIKPRLEKFCERRLTSIIDERKPDSNLTSGLENQLKVMDEQIKGMNGILEKINDALIPE